MDFRFSEAEERLRTEVRAFLREHAPVLNAIDRSASIGTLVATEEGFEQGKVFNKKLAERGWIAPAWPKKYGGMDASIYEQMIFSEEFGYARPPDSGTRTFGVSLLGPTLIVHGTEEQKKEHLSKILSGEVAWAQGYSEPGAGSDLASLQCRAERDGDDYVINGQKIWTSGAQFADWLFALVRTDPDAPKHRGISFLVMDIKTPGITVQPIVDMGWNEPFNETFFEDVRVPARNVIGDENRGLYVGMTLLDFERSGIGGAVGYRRQLNELREYLHTDQGIAHTRHDMDPVRSEIADRAIETEVLFNFAFRIVSMQDAGLIANYEASVNKLFGSELHQRLARTGVKAFGLYGNVWQTNGEYAPLRASFTRDYIGSVPHTIFSGSSEIQRNVIATRGLGLPRG